MVGSLRDVFGSIVSSAIPENSRSNGDNYIGREQTSTADPPIAHDGGAALEEQDQPDPVDGSQADSDAEVDFDDEKLLNGIGLPLFMLGRDGRILAWNESMERLTGVTAGVVDGPETVREALFPSADQSETLAERVLSDPDRAQEDPDVTLSEGSLDVFTTEREVEEEDGSICYYECSARPLYQDGELTAVLQTIQDRTADVQRHTAVSALVEELITTFEALGDGDLGARATFDDRDDVVDDELLVVTEEVNTMAGHLESLVERVDAQAEDLAELTEETTRAAHQIDSHVVEQRDLLDTVGEEMEEFSANMEEVAASADQIASAADDAQGAAKQGREAGEQARSATEEVIDSSQELVEVVQNLETRIGDIEEVLEVIDDVAEQTNMLALNASIESARAGEAGDGFGVVANEIKQLASQTREHTKAIDESVDAIQNQADTATTAVEETHTKVQEASDEIEDALSSLEEIAESVDETTTGVQEVAEANETQASTVQEVQGIVDDARDHADNVEEAGEDIVQLIEQQQTEISELKTRVSNLSGD